MPLSLNQVTELQRYRPLERVAILNIALKRLTPPEKASLNIIKLLLFVPPFFLLAQLGPFLALAGVILVLLAFSLLARPIHILFAAKHWPEAIKAYENSKADEDDN
ncbi:hypothetical protein GCM10011369_20350 [Neiella marina]|uniref:Uncharacterized protein n=1 Tax=Neiella marina TaxID=508461 RepID=A0A8J2U5C9_9GAMM|nr:DUF6170 family protein [Neiella marina]GGA78388.1 hypothetical protein GCM10011369_20350 [Neiella marina]